MTCERCGQRTASVRYIEIEEGVKRSRWLCERCATEEGAQAPPEVAGGGGLPVFLDPQQSASHDDESGDLPCPGCGTAFEDLHGHGLLGCPRCYEHFHDRLAQLLGRFHRATTHLGKSPRARGERAEMRLEIAQLRGRLEVAVAAEDFESAAALRDRLQQLVARLQAVDRADPAEDA